MAQLALPPPCPVTSRFPRRTLRGGSFGSGFGSALATLDANGEKLGVAGMLLLQRLRRGLIKRLMRTLTTMMMLIIK